MATLGLPRAASSLEELNKYLLPEFAPNYDALVKTSEPDRSLLWMACLFQLVKGHDLEQVGRPLQSASSYCAEPESKVAFWKLYQAQFHPHHDKQPLATASALISAAEGFARPDKIEAGDGQAALYVLKDLKVKSAEDRLLAMVSRTRIRQTASGSSAVLQADLRMVDGRLQAAGKATSIASPSPSVKPTPVASPFPSVNPPIDESPVPPRKRPRSDGPEAPTEPPTTPATTPFASSSSSSGTNSSSSASASPILDGSTELLCPTDAERIGRFPEPHRTKIWLACIFSPDAQKGIGQEALSALYARQFDTLYSSCVKLQSPAEVVGTVPTVFPDAKIILRPALAQNGSAFVQGIRIRSPFFHSKALVRHPFPFWVRES